MLVKSAVESIIGATGLGVRTVNCSKEYWEIIPNSGFYGAVSPSQFVSTLPGPAFGYGLIAVVAEFSSSTVSAAWFLAGLACRVVLRRAWDENS